MVVWWNCYSKRKKLGIFFIATPYTFQQSLYVKRHIDNVIVLEDRSVFYVRRDIALGYFWSEKFAKASRVIRICINNPMQRRNFWTFDSCQILCDLVLIYLYRSLGQSKTPISIFFKMPMCLSVLKWNYWYRYIV